MDKTNTQGFEVGTPGQPFETLGNAVNSAWDGAELRIRANDYSELMTISKRIRVTTEGGVTRIGD